MGQTQSAPYHPSAVSSHNFQTHLPPDQEGHQQSAARRTDVPRSLDGRLRSQPGSAAHDKGSIYQPLIPRELRRSGAGPIRHRPAPPEYAGGPNELAAHGPITASTLPAIAHEDECLAAQKQRRSVHRISATPRDPPLIEESESIRDHESVAGREEAASALEALESDHGHAPTPISPNLAMALKAGLGSGSLRLTADGLLAIQHGLDTFGEEAGLGIGEVSYQDTTLREPMSALINNEAGASTEKGRAHLLSFWERRPSVEATERTDSDGATQRFDDANEYTPRGPAAHWQSEWEDRRQNSSNNSSDPSPEKAKDACATAQLASRFSLSSQDLASQGASSGKSEGYAVLDPQSRFSFATNTTESSSGSNNQTDLGWASSEISNLQPPRPQPAVSSAAPRSHHPVREQSQTSMYSAAAPSSDFEPATLLASEDALMLSTAVVSAAQRATASALTQASRLILDETATICQDGRLSGEAGTSPRPSGGPVQPGSPPPPSPAQAARRPRAFSLMNVLRGRGRSSSNATQPDPTSQESSLPDASTPAAPVKAHNGTRPRAPSQPQAVFQATTMDFTPATKAADIRLRSTLPTFSAQNHAKASVTLGLSNKRVSAISREGSVHSASTLRSKRSSTMSLRAQNLHHAQGKKRLAGSAALPWWRQSSLKRKGSAGLSKDKQGNTLRSTAKKQSAGKAKQEEGNWEDLDENAERARAGNGDGNGNGNGMTVDRVQDFRGKGKALRHGPSAWPWSRKSNRSRASTASTMAATPQPTSPKTTLGTPAIGPERGEASSVPEAPVAIVSKNASSTGNPTATSSSASSFTSLAPPKPPTLLPPLRRPRCPSNRRHAAEESQCLSAASSLSVASAAATAGATAYWTRPGSQTSPNPSEATSVDGRTDLSAADTYSAREGPSTPGTSLADPLSQNTCQGHSARPFGDSVTESSKIYIAGPGGFMPALSPLAATFAADGPDSPSGSDAGGTKEVLISDRESIAGREDLQDSGQQLAVAKTAAQTSPVIVADERYPNMLVHFPVDTVNPRHTLIGGLPAPLRVARDEQRSNVFAQGGRPSVTQAQGVASDSSHHVRRGTDSTSYHSLAGSVDENVRAPPEHFSHGTRSISRPTSHREPSGQAQSFVTAHSCDASEARGCHVDIITAPNSIAAYGAPPRSTTAPMQTPGLNDPPQSIRSRPLPRIPEPYAAAERPGSKPFLLVGPPMSPSATYTPGLETADKMSGRQSWSSADGPWSAEVVSQNHVLAPARGFAVAQQASFSRTNAGKAVSHPAEGRSSDIISADALAASKQHPCAQHAGAVELLEDKPEAEALARQPSSSSISQSSAVQAPFADTGVQASLAALKALESPGNDLRTFWARRRMLGERDASHSSVAPATGDVSVEVPDELVGTRQRRRMEPYSSARSLRSSDGLSSSGSKPSRRRRNANASGVSRNGRRHVWDQTGMAELSSASLAETSGAASDSDAAASLIAECLRTQRRGVATSRKALPFVGDGSQARSNRSAAAAVAHDRVRAARLQSNRLPYATPPRSSMQHELRKELPLVEMTSPVGQAPSPRPEASQDRSATNDWDEVVVPAVRKRLEREALSAKGSLANLVSPIVATATLSPTDVTSTGKHEKLAGSVSRASHIPFPSTSEEIEAQGSYLQVDPYSLAKADRKAYRRALEQQLLELEKAEQDSNAGATHPRKPSDLTAPAGGDPQARTRHRSRTHRNSEGSRSQSYLRRGGEPGAASARDSSSHHRDKLSSSEARNTVNSHKASSASQSRGNTRRPSKQGYTDDDILAWQVGLDLSSGHRPSEIAEPVA